MMFKFLGLPFAALGDGALANLDPVLRRHPQPLSGFTMATLCAWQDVYHYGWHVVDGATALISFHFGDPDKRHLLQPVGPLTPQVQKLILDGARALPYPLMLVGVSQEFLAENAEFVSHFSVEADAGSANYIYSASDLATLPGRQYHKKRNLIAGAEREYTWEKEALTAANAPECLQMAEEMLLEDGQELTPSLANEMSALRHTMKNFEAHQQRGLVIRIGGTLAAFGLYEELRPGEAVQHFEKARRAYKGIYQVINQEMAALILEQGYQRINREEDLGNEGLRKAKHSYYPVELRPSHMLTFRQT